MSQAGSISMEGQARHSHRAAGRPNQISRYPIRIYTIYGIAVVIDQKNQIRVIAVRRGPHRLLYPVCGKFLLPHCYRSEPPSAGGWPRGI